MFGRRITLVRVLGFEIRADVSWVFLALLITWSLASGFFPHVYPGLAASTYWSMAVLGAAGLFFSLLFHELSHSVVARYYGLPIQGITLFLFGGVAEMEEEPQDARTELLMAIAGPIASVVLGVAFFVLSKLMLGAGVPEHVAGVPRYLGLVNGLLAGFNMIPAFPLDGGRAFRAALWQWRGDLTWATRIATRAGEGFGLLLIALGVLHAVSGNFVAGMWWFLIGLFLRGSASSAMERLRNKQALSGRTVKSVMTADPITVPPDISLAELVEDYLYRYHHEMFPVMDDSRLVGCVGTRQVREVPRETRETTRVQDVMLPADEDTTVESETPAELVLETMQRRGDSRLMVTENGRLTGIVTLRDLLDDLQMRRTLEEGP